MEEKIKQFLKTIKMNESMLSIIFGMITVVLIGILVFRMYKGGDAEITDTGENTEQSESMEKVGDVTVEVKDTGEKYVKDQPETYTVEAGDHLWKIAEKVYGSGYNWVDIAQENNLTNPGVVTVGEELKLPKVPVKEVKKMTADAPKMEEEVSNKIEGDSYTVVKGDNLWDISVRAYGDGYKWVEVAKYNDMSNPGYIEVDQVIKLPR